MKKILSVFMSIVMLISITAGLELTVNAQVLTGNCGKNGSNVTYSLDTSTGVLTISGSGKMYDYVYLGDAPWHSNGSSIKTVIINSGVTSIGEHAFYECYSLTSVTIPDSVTGIGDYAFQYCYSLTSVTIPDSLTSMGSCTFYGCDSLMSITIPNDVTSIGDDAFAYCSSLTSVTIPNSVTSIGNYAFYKCSSLTSIIIPDSVTSIGEGAFDYCSSLTSVTVVSDNQYYSSQDGVLFNKNKTTLIQYPIGNTRTSYTIPNSVTSIGDWAFDDCSSLTSITIPDSVTSIGNGAFNSCRSLTSITIPDSVTSISDDAFYDCSKLTSITIPDSVTSIGWSAFDGCSSLNDVYYLGTESQWNSISIDFCNECLTNANIHYNFTEEIEQNREFTLGRDNNSFIHYDESDDGFYGVTNHQIKDDYIREKLIKLCLSSGELGSILDQMNSKWEGSCYGIAETIGMNYLGYSTIDDISSYPAGDFYSLKRPCENPRLLDTIEYYQLTQLLKNYGRSSSNCIMTLYGWSGWWNEAPQKLSTYTNSDFYQLLLQAVAENYTVLLGYGEENGSGHAIITCGVEQISDKVYRIKLYDENDITHFGYLTITNNNGKYSAISTYNYIYKQGNEWINSGEDLLKHLNYMYYLPLDTLADIVPYTSVNSFSLDTFAIPDLSSSVSTYVSEDEDNSMVLVLDLQNDFSLELENGKNLNYSGGEFDGTVEIYDIQFIVNGNGSRIRLETEKTDTVEYTASDETYITVYDNNNYYSLSGTNIESANIDLENGMKLNGSNYDFTASVNRVVSNNDVEVIKIKGNANDDVIVKNDDNSISVSSEQTINNVSVESIFQDSSEMILENSDTKEIITDENNQITIEHNHNYLSTLTNVTCTETGIKTYTCTVCGDSYTEIISATGHNFGNNSPTCLVCGTANPNYVAPAPTPTQPTTTAPVQTTTPPAQTTTQPATTVKKPKSTSIKKLTKGKKQFKVTWKKVSGVAGYQIQYSTDKKFKKNNKTVTAKKSSTSATVKKLKSGKKYYVRVRTYKTVNGKKIYSSWSKVKSVKTK